MQIRGLTVEESLRQIEARATTLRYLAERTSESPVTSEPAVFSGLGDAFADIEQLARSARRSLQVEALSTELLSDADRECSASKRTQRAALRRRRKV